MLHIDFETYCDLDLKEVGAYRYVEHPSFEVLLCAYAFDGGPVRLWAPAEGEAMPTDLARALRGLTTCVAWNANFERCVIHRLLESRTWNNGEPRPWSSPGRWRCAMVQSYYCGLPGKLEDACVALNVPQDKAKLKDGTRLVTKFCKPRRPSKNNPATRWTPEAAPEDWERFKLYCRLDVEAERHIYNRLVAYAPLPDEEQEAWCIDQRMNDHGIALDLDLLAGALDLKGRIESGLVAEARELTRLTNPNSREQLMGWLVAVGGVDAGLVPDLTKATVSDLLARSDLSPAARRALELRQEMAKTSLGKYEKMAAAVCEDGRVRGTHQFYGANRTGRWAGRLLQTQNVPGGLDDPVVIAALRRLVATRDLDGIEAVWPSATWLLSALIRSVFVVPGGHVTVADLSAIEARVLAWLAGEAWRMEVFATHGKIYEASAAQMFNLDLDEVLAHKKLTGKHHPIRKKGKVAELALGYQGSVNAMIKMGALKEGLTEAELPQIVALWRARNRSIVAGWAACEAAFRGALRSPGTPYTAVRCTFLYDGTSLTVELPSGRKLYYHAPEVERFDDGTCCTFWGMDQETKRWGKQYTYGGKLIENITQAVSRDVLREIVRRMGRADMLPIMLVHDEAVAENAPLDALIQTMTKPIGWAKGLPLAAAGYTNPFYYKD